MDKLERFFKKHSKAALAFSGGTDSVYLLYAAKSCGAEVKAYLVKSEFQPAFEVEDAVRATEGLGVDLKIIETSVLSDERICANTAQRCYFCKKRIFSAIIERAKEDGFDTVIDGTNASDSVLDRPGYKALCEYGVLSPLKICGIDKNEVRARSKSAGLFTWDKPSYSCLATRVEGGEKITARNLQKIEKAEMIMFGYGYSDFRVRVSSDAARLEISEIQRDKFLAQKEELFSKLAELFSTVEFSGIWR